MEIKLAENIRAMRKERAMTQEQLAEVLGVTVGAVYKWEAKLSVPDVSLLMEMADFFDTSLDVLLGYHMKDNRIRVAADRLKNYRQDKEIEGLKEAEKYLARYPHSFEIVYESASLYRVFAVERHNFDYARRALELLDTSLLLLSQNKDIQISHLTIYGEMADMYLAMEEKGKALEILKANNADGIFNHAIGFILSQDNGEDAIPFLSEALLRSILCIIHIVLGYTNVYFSRKDYKEASSILLWGSRLLTGLRDGDNTSFLDKVNSVFLICLSYSEKEAGESEKSRRYLVEARNIASRFDKNAEYDINAIRYITLPKRASAYDDMGNTAMESIRNVLDEICDEKLKRMWMEVVDEKA